MQTSKQYYSLALWVIMLISLSLLSSCGGGSGGGSGDSNLGVQTSFGDELQEDTAIPINNNKFELDPDSYDSGVMLLETELNTENPPQPLQWKKGVEFGTRVQAEETTTPQIPLTIASLYKTDYKKYYGAVVTENGKKVGEGLIRKTGEALFVLDFIPGGSAGSSTEASGGLIFNAIGLDRLNPGSLDNYVGNYGCATPGCKDAIALGYLFKKGYESDKDFYHEVKININVKNEGNKLIGSVPAWFVSDQFNSGQFPELNEISKEFSKNENDEYFFISYRFDPDPDAVASSTISILGRLFDGGGATTNDVFIAGRYDFLYRDGQFDLFNYYGVYALEKTN